VEAVGMDLVSSSAQVPPPPLTDAGVAPPSPGRWGCPSLLWMLVLLPWVMLRPVMGLMSRIAADVMKMSLLWLVSLNGADIAGAGIVEWG